MSHTHLEQRLLVPLIRFGKPNNCARKFDGVAIVDHVLAYEPVHPHKYSKVKPAPVSNIGQWLMAPVLVTARLAKGK